ncbi:Arc family DNA-binding protein [uncultured Tolumonas sp.]|uniref:Arc family DNA-binding protein n=1 Tax=uncultured Tolumonas sp. TaxID=263765 RepID=UPI003747F6C2
MTKYPSQMQDKFNLRFPDGMREKIAEAAKLSGRSMNSEIIYRLQQSFDAGLPADEKPIRIIEGKLRAESQAGAANILVEIMEYLELHRDEIEQQKRLEEDAQAEIAEEYYAKFPVDDDEIEPDDEYR